MLGRGGRPGLLGMAARTAVVAGTATAVSGRVTRRQEQRAYEEDQQRLAEAQQQAYAQQQQAYAEQQQAYAAPPPAPQRSDLLEQLTRLAGLRDQGVLSDAEFGAAKAKLLG